MNLSSVTTSLQNFILIGSNEMQIRKCKNNFLSPSFLGIVRADLHLTFYTKDKDKDRLGSWETNFELLIFCLFLVSLVLTWDIREKMSTLKQIGSILVQVCFNKYSQFVLIVQSGPINHNHNLSEHNQFRLLIQTTCIICRHEFNLLSHRLVLEARNQDSCCSSNYFINYLIKLIN